MAYSTYNIGPSTSLASATTTIDIGSSDAPTAGQVLVASSGTEATWQDQTGGGSTIPSTTNLIEGDGAGNGANSGIAASNVGLKNGNLSQFAATTSAQLRTLLSDETGTGAAYFQNGDLGTPSAGVATNLTGTATGLTAGIANALKSATTSVDVSAATAPSNGQALVATSSTTATWQTLTTPTTTTVGTSRSLTSADNGNMLEVTADLVSLTVPTGLPTGFACGFIPYGTTSIVSSGGTLLNGATTTLNRTAAAGVICAIVGLASASDSYSVTTD